MRYAQIRRFDIANGVGIRTSLFVTGCTFGCEGCFNEAYQDPNFGEIYDDEAHNTIVANLSDPAVSGLTVLGGEPLQNCEGLIPALRQLRAVLRPDQTIWLYSGYTFEQILADKEKFECLTLVDVLVDGLFVLAKRNLSLRFCGSENQRLIDVPKSLASGQVVLWSNKE